MTPAQERALGERLGALLAQRASVSTLQAGIRPVDDERPPSLQDLLDARRALN